jgi:hypothetical protein
MSRKKSKKQMNLDKAADLIVSRFVDCMNDINANLKPLDCCEDIECSIQYAEFLVFCLIGDRILEQHGPEKFEDYIEQIETNVGGVK